jgi:hypothetical protein
VITGVVVVIAIFLGAVTGCILTMTIATAAISCSQESMMRKVRYWQAEAARARQALHRLRPESGYDASASRD